MTNNSQNIIIENKSHKDIFTTIYETEEWGKDYKPIYHGSCGRGCTLEYNKKEFIPFLKQFIINNNIKTIVDLGCGNAEYALSLYSDIAMFYYGYDVYDKVIEYNNKFNNHKKFFFISMDVLQQKEQLIEADLCIIKDVLQHWTISDISLLLDYLTTVKKYKYIMIINCSDQRGDLIMDPFWFNSGKWRQLSALYLPLKKYGTKIIFTYDTKEVSIIQNSSLDSKEKTLMNVAKSVWSGGSTL